MAYCCLGHLEKSQYQLNKNTAVFMHEDESQTIICKLAAILCRPQMLICMIRDGWCHIYTTGHRRESDLMINSPKRS